MPLKLQHACSMAEWFRWTLTLLIISVSTITKGAQMVPVLNAVGTNCAVYGNHEFGTTISNAHVGSGIAQNWPLFWLHIILDFGLDILSDLVEKTTFPWLMSNVIDNETEMPLGDGKVKYILESNGKKIGLVSTALSTCQLTLIRLNESCPC